jgi:hypothetical protein
MPGAGLPARKRAGKSCRNGEQRVDSLCDWKWDTFPTETPHKMAAAQPGGLPTDVPREDAAQPRVSVVMPVHEAAATIERALNSVYAQTYANIIEVIVVDDGSRDDTCQIIEEKFPQVRLIHQENAGSPTARNRGVGEAQGEYIAFLDDDDEWLPDKTLKQMQAFASHPGLVFILAGASDVGYPPPAPAPYALRQLTFDHCFPVISAHYGCSQWIIRKSVIEEVGGFSVTMRRAQDAELIWRMLSLGYAIAYLTEVLSRYYPSQERNSAQQQVEDCEQWYAGMISIIDGYALQPPGAHWLAPARAAKALHQLHFRAAWKFAMVGKRAEARCEFAEAAKWPAVNFWEGFRHRVAGWWPTVCCRLIKIRNRMAHRAPSLLPWGR